jgi:hypothetical protein
LQDHRDPNIQDHKAVKDAPAAFEVRIFAFDKTSEGNFRDHFGEKENANADIADEREEFEWRVAFEGFRGVETDGEQGDECTKSHETSDP